MQVEHKWYNALSKDKLKFYRARNFWEKASLPFLHDIIWLATRTTSK